jgi:SAM-dependent methyltransferase
VTAEEWGPEQAARYREGRVFSDADRHVLDMLAGARPRILVELGCGPGVIRERAGFVERYVCTDGSVHFLRRLPHTSGPDLRACCDCRRIPFRDGSADCVLAMAVLHHLDDAGIDRSLSEICRVLRPGGFLLLLEDWCLPGDPTPFERAARKVRFEQGPRENHLEAEAWIERMEESGLDLEDVTWVRRPFHSGDIRLAGWPPSARVVRMGCFRAVRAR